MAGRLEGKVALVSGAARGQGRSHALRLAQEGVDVIAFDVCRQLATVPYPTATPEDLTETVRQVEELDRRVVAREADVRDSAALAALVTEGVGELGRLDIVCANAGIVTFAENAWSIPDETWDEMIAVNLLSDDGAANAQNLLPVEMVEAVDISDAVLWLASDEARYVTGVSLPVDAGFLQK